MKRREFLSRAGWGAAALALGGHLAGCAHRRRPNFLLILVDDLGWADCGFSGSSFYETPHLDRLAYTGMRFTDAYAASPVCSPTRAAILTGKSPARLNITDYIPGEDPRDRKLIGPEDLHHLPLDEVTLAEALKKTGYATFFAGKWHLGGEGFYPENQGFDINRGGWESGGPYGGNRYYSPYGNPRLDDGPEGEYLTDRLTDETIGFIEANRNRPFFAQLSFYTVHTPIIACRRFEKKFEEKSRSLPPLEGPDQLSEHDGWTKTRQDNAEYASMIHAMDENVGRLLKSIDELGLKENTVIVFTSDNGGLSTLLKHGYPTSNRPLRAGKGWCYEGGIRVPLLVRIPGMTRPGAVCSEPVISMDFYPTFLDLAGQSLLPGQQIDGRSLIPLMKQEGSLGREFLFWHYPHYHGSAWRPGSAIREGDWKLIEFYDWEKVELYHLSRDIGETRDLSSLEPERAGRLLRTLRSALKDAGARMPEPGSAIE